MTEHATQDVERWQVDTTAAEVYEEMFVPALFRGAAEQLVGSAGLERGQRVLDVGCGTGIVARLAAIRVGPEGTVTGLDPNPGMLAVAARIEPRVQWRKGEAERLPFADNAFEVVLSQFAIMFFADPLAAVREMTRVVRPGGRVRISLWDGLDRNPDFGMLADLGEERFGTEVARVLRAPFMPGDPHSIVAAFEQAGLTDIETRTATHWAHFPSVRSWLYMESKGSPIGAMLDDAALNAFVDELEPRFTHVVQDDGSARLSLSAHVVSARL